MMETTEGQSRHIDSRHRYSYLQFVRSSADIVSVTLRMVPSPRPQTETMAAAVRVREVARFGTYWAIAFLASVAFSSWSLNRGPDVWWIVSMDSWPAVILAIGAALSWRGGRIVRRVGWGLIVLSAPPVLYQLCAIVTGVGQTLLAIGHWALERL